MIHQHLDGTFTITHGPRQARGKSFPIETVYFPERHCA
jgi:hypothetical protein